MENNIYQDPNAQIRYDYYTDCRKKANAFLTKSIVAFVIAWFPIGSIVGMIMGSKNRAALLDYLSHGGLASLKTKISSALSRTAKYAGIGLTIFWALFGICYILFIVGLFTLIKTQK